MRQVDGFEALFLEQLADLLGLITIRHLQPDEYMRFFVIADAVIEFSHSTRADQLTEALEAATLFGNRHGKYRFMCLTHLGTFGNEA